jgi:hypothetical protein
MTQHNEMREQFEREAAWRRREALPIPPFEPEHKQLMQWAARYDHLAATVGAVPAALYEALRARGKQRRSAYFNIDRDIPRQCGWLT